jgi:hypothetical protein
MLRSTSDKKRIPIPWNLFQSFKVPKTACITLNVAQYLKVKSIHVVEFEHQSFEASIL